jgi:hypothetical protein
MKAQGLAEPQRRSTGTAELLALGRNRAYRFDSTKHARKNAILGAGKELSAREAEERPAREAEQQERAARLLTDAERIARSISFGPALSDVAKVLAATDPDHAERIARRRSASDRHSLQAHPIMPRVVRRHCRSQLFPAALVGCGSAAGRYHPVDQAGGGQALACFVLQVGQRSVAGWVRSGR